MTDLKSPARDDLKNWLVRAVAEKLDLPPEQIQTDTPFDEYGLDSAAAVSLSGKLGELLNQDLPGTLLYEYPTINELSDHLARTN